MVPPDRSGLPGPAVPPRFLPQARAAIDWLNPKSRALHPQPSGDQGGIPSAVSCLSPRYNFASDHTTSRYRKTKNATGSSVQPVRNIGANGKKYRSLGKPEVSRARRLGAAGQGGDVICRTPERPLAPPWSSRSGADGVPPVISSAGRRVAGALLFGGMDLQQRLVLLCLDELQDRAQGLVSGDRGTGDALILVEGTVGQAQPLPGTSSRPPRKEIRYRRTCPVQVVGLMPHLGVANVMTVREVRDEGVRRGDVADAREPQFLDQAARTGCGWLARRGPRLGRSWRRGSRCPVRSARGRTAACRVSREPFGSCCSSSLSAASVGSQAAQRPTTYATAESRMPGSIRFFETRPRTLCGSPPRPRPRTLSAVNEPAGGSAPARSPRLPSSSGLGSPGPVPRSGSARARS